MDEMWQSQIESLQREGVTWASGTTDHQQKICVLVEAIGAAPELQQLDREWLVDQLKQKLGCPKGALRQLMQSTSAPSPLPAGCVEATAQPADLQAAGLLCQEHRNLIAERSWALFRYDAAAGFWALWADTPAKKASQAALQRLAVQTRDGWIRPHGSAAQVKATVDQLKVLTSGGVLGAIDQPNVIVFRNGTYNLSGAQLEQHNPNHGATYGVAADYIDQASCPAELQAVIDRCYPPGAEAILRAMIRWAIDPSIRYGEAFHIVGDSGTGKGLLIDFIRSLFPPSVVGQLQHPADLSSPEKVHQYIVGRRLVAFPDAPANLNRRDGDSCNLFYELVENKPITTRKLFAGESEESRPMHCRFILGSVRPLHFRDGRDGYLRRVITLNTLPRSGTPDANIREKLNPPGDRFDQIRAEAISWALAMPLDVVNAVLNRDDPDGLLRDAAQDAAVNSDIVSQWADQCLEPTLPDLPVGPDSWADLYTCFLGWAEHERVNSHYISRRTNFVGQVRKILGPDRCLPRQPKTKQERERDGSSARWWPALDAGFALRPGILSRGSHDIGCTGLTQVDFKPSEIREGGLERIAALRPARRTWLNSGEHSLRTVPAQGMSTGQAESSDPLPRNETPA